MPPPSGNSERRGNFTLCKYNQAHLNDNYQIQHSCEIILLCNYHFQISPQKSIPALISNNHSLPSMIEMQQIGSPSKFLIPITVKGFYFFVAFYLCNTMFPKNLFLYYYMTISSHVRISSNFFTKKHCVRPEKILFTLQPE